MEKKEVNFYDLWKLIKKRVIWLLLRLCAAILLVVESGDDGDVPGSHKVIKGFFFLII